LLFCHLICLKISILRWWSILKTGEILNVSPFHGISSFFRSNFFFFLYSSLFCLIGFLFISFLFLFLLILNHCWFLLLFNFFLFLILFWLLFIIFIKFVFGEAHFIQLFLFLLWLLFFDSFDILSFFYEGFRINCYIIITFWWIILNFIRIDIVCSRK
jgi:hypothetical protein